MGFAVGYIYTGGEDKGLVVKTTDGGETWQEQTFGMVQAELRSVCFTDSQTGYIVGGSHYDALNDKEVSIQLKTTDGGNTWTQTTIDNHERLHKLWFVNSQVGYISGPFAALLKTTNAGATWSSVEVKGASWLYSMFFWSEDNGFTVGYGGKIYKATK